MIRKSGRWRWVAAILFAVATLCLQSASVAAAAPVPEDLTWEDPAERTLPTAPAGWRTQICCPTRSAQVVTTPTRSGGHAVRFQLDRGDPIVAASSRAELVDTTAEPADAERWYGFSVFLPSTVWQKPDPSAEILAQWHHAANTGSPPLSLTSRNGRWEISQHWEQLGQNGKHTVVGNQQVGRWTDWVFHIRWSEGANGLVEVWKDGVRVFQQTGKNKYADGAGTYFKFGIYKWDWTSNLTRSNTDRRIVFHDELRIRDGSGSYSAVAPR